MDATIRLKRYWFKVKSAQDALLGLSSGYSFGTSQIGGFPMSYSSRRSSSSGGSGSPNSPPSPPHPMLAASTGLRVLPSSRFYSLQYNNAPNGSQNMSRMGYTSPQVSLKNAPNPKFLLNWNLSIIWITSRVSFSSLVFEQEIFSV